MIFPFTPSYIICQDDDLFTQFEDGIFNYLSQFSESDYLDRGSSVANTENPFAFNEHLNNEFLSKWVRIYRRSKAVVSVKMYNELLMGGLLDKEHTIGK